MKKLLIGLLAFLVVFPFAFSRKASAESTNIITGGDFEGFLAGGKDILPLTDPAYADGVMAGWGSMKADSKVNAVKDPLNDQNTVLMFSKSTGDWSSLFKFAAVKSNTTYNVSFKYLVEGTTDNFGFGFAGPCPRLEKIFYSGAATDGWQTANFEMTTLEHKYDSIHFWCHTTEGNKGYIDDVVVTEKVQEPVKPEVTNIITGGTFEGFIAEGSDSFEFPDPVLNEGPQAGWGSFKNDSHVKAVKDPLNDQNTVIVFGKSTADWSSFFKFATVKSNTTYNVSFKYLVEGTTDNFGIGFAGACPRLEKIFYSGEGTEGWQTASFEMTTLEHQYDSIHMWFHTTDPAIKGYVDDIVITEKTGEVVNPDPTPEPTAENIITGGNFEGFLGEEENEVNFPDPVFNSGVKNGWGSLAFDSHAKAVKDPLNNQNTVLVLSYTDQNEAFSSFFKFAGIQANHKYTISFKYLVEGTTDNFGFGFAGSPKFEKTFHEGGATDGWKTFTMEFTTDKDSTYDSIRMWFNTGKDEANKGYVDDIVVKDNGEQAEVTPTPEPENPFDPEKTYYPSKSMTVNGDFEKFEVGTVLTEEQLEGAWGTVGLDNSAVISEVDGSHVLDLGKGSKEYTSAFLMLPDTLEQGDLMRITYEIKLVLSEDKAAYKAIDSCLVGGSNTSYYLVNYKNFDLASDAYKTEGAESLHYPVRVEALENGWSRITFDYQITRKDLIQTNSLRFLFTALGADDHMYIDNVNLYQLQETPWPTDVDATEVSFNDGASISLKKGESKTLAVTVGPEDCTNKAVTFESSNSEVATVDANGKVEAVGKGACTITVTTHNGLTAEIAVVVTEEEAPTKPSRKGCSGSVVATLAGVAVLAGALVVVKRRKDEE